MVLIHFLTSTDWLAVQLQNQKVSEDIQHGAEALFLTKWKLDINFNTPHHDIRALAGRALPADLVWLQLSTKYWDVKQDTSKMWEARIKDLELNHWAALGL